MSPTATAPRHRDADVTVKTQTQRQAHTFRDSPSSAAKRALAGGLPYRLRLLLVAAACVGAGCVAFSIDLPVAAWFKRQPSPVPGELMRLLNFSEAFAHGLGVAALFAVLLVVDRSLTLPWPGRSAGSRTEFLRLVAATAAGGLTVDVIKLLVERVRPRAADLGSVTSVFATFGSSTLAEPDPRAADIMSFPSGHAAVAAGFAAALGWRYRHAAPAFAALAGLAALQRVATSAHYPSDVAFGAAVGLLGAALSLGRDADQQRSTSTDSMADSG